MTICGVLSSGSHKKMFALLCGAVVCVTELTGFNESWVRFLVSSECSGIKFGTVNYVRGSGEDQISPFYLQKNPKVTLKGRFVLAAFRDESE